MELKKITGFLDNYLRIKDFEDSSYNGLQFEGKDDVKKVMFAVDAGLATFEKAVMEGADMIVVHHGHFWQSANPSITGWAKERFSLLHEHEISLYAVHLPLDQHRDCGNNSQLLKLIGAQISSEFGSYHGQNIGWIGEFVVPKDMTEIISILDGRLQTRCKCLSFGKKKIKSVAVCTGGGGNAIFSEALTSGVDLYITGDSTEVYHTAKDAKMNVIFAGHHATETLGVKALCEVVGGQLGIETVFVDIPTGL